MNVITNTILTANPDPIFNLEIQANNGRMLITTPSGLENEIFVVIIHLITISLINSLKLKTF